jgi:hypothetical protein
MIKAFDQTENLLIFDRTVGSVRRQQQNCRQRTYLAAYTPQGTRRDWNLN